MVRTPGFRRAGGMSARGVARCLDPTRLSFPNPVQTTDALTPGHAGAAPIALACEWGSAHDQRVLIVTDRSAHPVRRTPSADRAANPNRAGGLEDIAAPRGAEPSPPLGPAARGPGSRVPLSGLTRPGGWMLGGPHDENPGVAAPIVQGYARGRSRPSGASAAYSPPIPIPVKNLNAQNHSVLREVAVSSVATRYAPRVMADDHQPVPRGPRQPIEPGDPGRNVACSPSRWRNLLRLAWLRRQTPTPSTRRSSGQARAP